jgi:hypothetical protein
MTLVSHPWSRQPDSKSRYRWSSHPEQLMQTVPVADIQLSQETQCEIKLFWRTSLQVTGYVRATAPNSVKVDNNPK